MNLPPITIEVARDLLRRAMETQGSDFVYNPGGEDSCHYAPLLDTLNNEGDPRNLTGCLIGTALKLHGLTSTTLEVADEPIDSMAGRFADYGVVDIKDHAVRYFRIAQRAQDSGASWGTALERAEDWLAVNPQLTKEPTQ